VILNLVAKGKQSSFLLWWKYSLKEPYKSNEW
jgi:hypothetical protein